MKDIIIIIFEALHFDLGCMLQTLARATYDVYEQTVHTYEMDS